ncbi:MAG: glutaredoxin family protein [Terriglobia bacterium]
MYTSRGCEDSDAAREFLKSHHIPFDEVSIDQNPEALQFVMNVNEGKRRTPTFDVDGRTFHCSQFDAQKLTRDLALDLGSRSKVASPEGRRQ